MWPAFSMEEAQDLFPMPFTLSLSCSTAAPS